MAWLQMLIRAHVAANTAVQTPLGGPLSDAELQEGLMAGFGARARRKHIQRHAARSGGRNGLQQVGLDNSQERVSRPQDGVVSDSATSADEQQALSSTYNASINCSGACKPASSIENVHHQRLDMQAGRSVFEGCNVEDTWGEAVQLDSSTPVEAELEVQACEQTSPSKANLGMIAAEGQNGRNLVADLGRGGNFWHGER